MLLNFFDRKLLAAHAANQTFPPFLRRLRFQLWTDHKPLVTAISCISAPISPRQQCHLAFISEFNVQLLYFFEKWCCSFFVCPNQTTTGSVAAMSAMDPVDFKEMAAEQNRCPEM
jgi:hypothetical protein